MGQKRSLAWETDLLSELIRDAVGVRTWHQLRREHALGLEETRRHIEDLVESLLPSVARRMRGQ